MYKPDRPEVDRVRWRGTCNSACVARVQLLYWRGCPSHPAALRDLRAALAEAGYGCTVELVEVESEEQAAAESFIGSPTIRIDGMDLVPPPPAEPTGLTCRIYVRRDGRISPTPDPADLRAAVERSMRTDGSPRP